MMKRSDFEYHLPQELIAQQPASRRDASRLMLLDSRQRSIGHKVFSQLPDLLSGDELLVFNNSKVIPARLWGSKMSGGRVEVLVTRILSNGQMEAITRSSKPLSSGSTIRLDKTGTVLTVLSVPVAGRALLETPLGVSPLPLVYKEGAPPLPPYIHRPGHESDDSDKERYQTVYAQPEGSVAAPTAGLHFTREILEKVRERGCEIAFITLHVGPGTFMPVRVDDVSMHKMEREYYTIHQETVDSIRRAQEAGRPILAVGTTTVRCLESAALAVNRSCSKDSGDIPILSPGEDSTELFITPGFRFRIVTQLLTNFHLPGSTLIMLVSALCGRERLLEAYDEAVKDRYRFYSFGDCMLVR